MAYSSKPLQNTIVFVLLLLSKAALTQEQNTEYDTYAFALEWSGTVCKFNDCRVFDKSYSGTFNIHGLWPDRNNGDNPFFCTNTPLGYSDLQKGLQYSLQSYWSGLYSDDQSFLEHEWGKHGTCWNPQYGNMDEIPEKVRSFVEVARERTNQIPSDYLNLVVHLSSDVYRIFNDLEKQGIVPSDNQLYSLSQIKGALKKAYGTDEIAVNCLRDETGQSYFSDILMCLDKNYNPIPCKTAYLSGGCPSTGLKYPEKKIGDGEVKKKTEVVIF